jgi:hypothetical protein
MADTAAETFLNLTIDLVDSGDGVTAHGDELQVHAKPFARLLGDELSVLLPPARVSDLETRGIASGRDGDWLLFASRELWSEMAREAHEYVGEPPVGHQS